MFLSGRCCEREENECHGERLLEQRRNFLECMFTIMTCVRNAQMGTAASVELPPSSLRAKRSNPEFLYGDNLDCFVVSLFAMTRGS